MSSSSRRITSDGAFLRAVASVAGGDFEPAAATAVRSRLSASIDAFDRAVARLKHEGFLVKATELKVDQSLPESALLRSAMVDASSPATSQFISQWPIQ